MPCQLVAELPADRERLGLSVGQMAWRFGLKEYRELEADELFISSDLSERIMDLCGWPC